MMRRASGKSETLPPIVGSAQPPRLLVIGLDPGTRSELERLLGAKDVTELRRGDLAATWEAVATTEPDLVAMDLEADGDFQLVRQLKLLPDTHFVPLIASTAPFARAQAYACGADHVVDRPMTADGQRELLVVRAEALIRSAAASRALRSSRQELRLRRDWVRYLVHDLRNLLTTPLTQIGLVTRDRIHDEAEKREVLASVERDMWKAAALIDDLLDVDRIRKGVVTLRRVDVDLVALAARVAGSHGDAAHKARTPIEMRAGVPELLAPADEGLLERVLSNLVSNGLRYAPEGTPLTLELARADGAAIIRVTNLGPSIEPADAAHIFEPFVRSDDGRPGATGAGLGLAFCRLAVEIHGGRISVEGGPGGRGATFVVRLPLEELTDSMG